jgi:hypothetical protein
MNDQLVYSFCRIKGIDVNRSNVPLFFEVHIITIKRRSSLFLKLRDFPDLVTIRPLIKGQNSYVNETIGREEINLIVTALVQCGHLGMARIGLIDDRVGLISDCFYDRIVVRHQALGFDRKWLLTKGPEFFSFVSNFGCEVVASGISRISEPKLGLIIKGAFNTCFVGKEYDALNSILADYYAEYSYQSFDHLICKYFQHWDFSDPNLLSWLLPSVIKMRYRSETLLCGKVSRFDYVSGEVTPSLFRICPFTVALYSICVKSDPDDVLMMVKNYLLCRVSEFIRMIGFGKRFKSSKVYRSMVDVMDNFKTPHNDYVYGMVDSRVSFPLNVGLRSVWDMYYTSDIMCSHYIRMDRYSESAFMVNTILNRFFDDTIISCVCSGEFTYDILRPLSHRICSLGDNGRKRDCIVEDHYGSFELLSSVMDEDLFVDPTDYSSKLFSANRAHSFGMVGSVRKDVFPTNLYSLFSSSKLIKSCSVWSDSLHPLFGPDSEKNGVVDWFAPVNLDDTLFDASIDTTFKVPIYGTASYPETDSADSDIVSDSDQEISTVSIGIEDDELRLLADNEGCLKDNDLNNQTLDLVDDVPLLLEEPIGKPKRRRRRRRKPKILESNNVPSDIKIDTIDEPLEIEIFTREQSLLFWTNDPSYYYEGSMKFSYRRGDPRINPNDLHRKYRGRCNEPGIYPHEFTEDLYTGATLCDRYTRVFGFNKSLTNTTIIKNIYSFQDMLTSGRICFYGNDFRTIGCVLENKGWSLPGGSCYIELPEGKEFHTPLIAAVRECLEECRPGYSKNKPLIELKRCSLFSQLYYYVCDNYTKLVISWKEMMIFVPMTKLVADLLPELSSEDYRQLAIINDKYKGHISRFDRNLTYIVPITLNLNSFVQKQ